MADTYTLHKDLVDQANLHITKFHADTHEAGGTDEIDWESLSNLKNYIDSQIAGENHWDLDSGGVLVPYIPNSSMDLGSGDITTTGDVTCGTLYYTSLSPTVEAGEWDLDSGNTELTPKTSGVNVNIGTGDFIGQRYYLNANAYLVFNSGDDSIDFIIV